MYAFLLFTHIFIVFFLIFKEDFCRFLIMRVWRSVTVNKYKKANNNMRFLKGKGTQDKGRVHFVSWQAVSRFLLLWAKRKKKTHFQYFPRFLFFSSTQPLISLPFHITTFSNKSIIQSQSLSYCFSYNSQQIYFSLISHKAKFPSNKN